MAAKKFLSCVLAVAAMLFVSCADSKQKAIDVGDRFMKAYLVDVDFGVLMKYSTGDAKRLVDETYEGLGPDGIAKMRRDAKEAMVIYKLDEERSAFTKGLVTLVYEVRVGPEYTRKYSAQIELSGGRGVWKVSFYSI